MMREEKRKEKRKQEEHKVELEILIEDSQKKPDFERFTAFTENLSLSGVKIKTKKYFPINTILKIKLPLLGKKSVCLRGKIRWVKNIREEKNFGVGIEFIDTLPAEFIALMEHLYGASRT